MSSPLQPSASFQESLCSRSPTSGPLRSSFLQRGLDATRAPRCGSRPSPRHLSTCPRVSPRPTAKSSGVLTLATCHHSCLTPFARNVGHSHAPLSKTSESKLPPSSVSPEPETWALVPPPLLGAGLRGERVGVMTARGTPSRFLTSVLHNGLGRYVQQLQRLSLSLSRDAPSSRGAR